MKVKLIIILNISGVKLPLNKYLNFKSKYKTLLKVKKHICVCEFFNFSWY